MYVSRDWNQDAVIERGFPDHHAAFERMAAIERRREIRASAARTLMSFILIAICAAPIAAYAVGQPPPADPAANARASAASAAVAASSATAAAGAIAAQQQQVQQSIAGGDTAVSVDASPQIDNATTLEIEGDNIPHQAPAIAMTHPMATMECIRGFGIGGSWTKGAVILGPQWKDGDCTAYQRFQSLADMGLAEPAAAAYCGRVMHAADFGPVNRGFIGIGRSIPDATRQTCEANIQDAVRAMHVVSVTPPADPVKTETAMVRKDYCDERLRRCQAEISK